MAQAPYDGVPRVSPDAAPPPDYQQIQTNPRQFGAAVGEGLGKLGEGATTAAKFFGQVQTDDALNNAMDRAGKALEKFKGLRGADALHAQADTNTEINAAFSEARGGLLMPEQKYQFDQTSRAYRERYVAGQVSNHANQQADAYATQTNNATYQRGKGIIAADPDDPDALQQGLSLMHQGRIKNLQLNGLAGNADVLARENGTTNSDYLETRIKALAPTNPTRASQLLEANRKELQAAGNYDALNSTVANGTTQHFERMAGTDLKGAFAEYQKQRDTLPAETQTRLDTIFEQKRLMEDQRGVVDQSRRLALDDKLRRDAAEKSGNTFVQQILKDPTQVDPKAIADDPHLTFEQKWSVTGMLNAELQGKAQGKDTATYGPGFWDVYKAVHLPADDPNRIADPSQLYALAGQGGRLTVAGVDKLTTEIQGKRSSPEGQAESQMKMGAVAYAKHQLSFEVDYGMVKIPDPKGMDAFNVGFLPAFNKAYDVGIKAGKTPDQLLSKESPDFIVDKVIAPYKRNPAQLAKDQIEAGMEMPAAAPAADKPLDLTTAPGIVAAYMSGRMTREQAEAEAMKRGFLKPVAAAEPPAPIP